MGKRPMTFAQALAAIEKRSGPPPALADVEGKFFDLLETEIDKLRPASRRVAKMGRQFSAERVEKLKEAVSLLDEIDHAASASPDGQADAALVIPNVVKATALIMEATEDPTMSPVTVKRASESLDAIAERVRTPGMSHAEAINKALDTPEGAAAYEAYDAGRQRGDAPEFTPAAPVAKGAGSPAWDRICALADEMVQKSARPMTQEAARARVMEDNPKLYERYEQEAGRIRKTVGAQFTSEKAAAWSRVREAGLKLMDTRPGRYRTIEEAIAAALAERPSLYATYESARDDVAATDDGSGLYTR